MKVQSAGILLYRFRENSPELFLVHPGGPFYARKDEGVWSIPKGEFKDDEDPLDAARREFREETGVDAPEKCIPLTPVSQKSGKKVYCFACEGDIDAGKLISNVFEMEWPPRSEKKQSFPEIDKGEWFDMATAKTKIIEAQRPLIDELLSKF
ncbi:MAG: NUDIX domain-containing protein [Methanococcaceae archaeon]